MRDRRRVSTPPRSNPCWSPPRARTIGADPGRREFWSLPFAVSPATLIPRPNRKPLVEAALAAFTGRQPPRRVLDLGTGTGCLLLAVLSEFPHRVRRRRGSTRRRRRPGRRQRRGARHGGPRPRSCAADWADALDGTVRSRLVQSALHPYLGADGLMPDVARYEPRTALDGGADGLAAYRRLVPELPRTTVAGRSRCAGVGRWTGEHGGRMAGEAGLAVGSRGRFVGHCAGIGALAGLAMKKPFGRPGWWSLACARQGQPRCG